MENESSGPLKDLKETVKGLWSKYGILFIVVGAFLLVAKFSSVLMDLIAFFSKRLVEKTQQKSDQLQAEENAANQAANKLIDDANKLPSQQQPVDEDWYKNGKK